MRTFYSLWETPFSWAHIELGLWAIGVRVTPLYWRIVLGPVSIFIVTPWGAR